VFSVKPAPVDHLSVVTNDSYVSVSFNSPKAGKILQYNVTADCGKDGSREVN